MMVKKLSAVGNSLGLIIERPILELLDISKDIPLEVTTDKRSLIIRPMRKAPLMDRALAAADRLMDAHVKTPFADAQVIVIENERQLPGDRSLDDVNVVLFTGNDQGRRGFIPQAAGVA